MTTTPATPMPRVGLIVDGRPMVAEVDGVGTTTIYDIRGRQVIAATSPDQVITLRLTPLDTELQDRAAANARVKAAAAGPWTPKLDRPAARQQAVRAAARQYHSAVWANGCNEGEARYEARPLNQRITEADVPALVEIATAAILCDPALRAEFRLALDAVELEDLFIDA